MLRSSLYDYSDAYILASGTITITGAGAHDGAKRLDEINKGVILKYCAPFIDCVSEINRNKINHAKYLDVVMPIYNLIKYSNTSRILWQYYRNESATAIVNSESFKSKIRITGKTPAHGNTKDFKKAVPLKHFLQNS